MKKALPVIVALVLIVAIGGAAVGKWLYDKYSYSKETADMDAYFGVSEGELAVILQDEKIEEKAVLRESNVYFDLSTVHAYFNDGFYADLTEQKLLYTTANDTVVAAFGERGYSDGQGEYAEDYVCCYLEDGVLYLAADYVKKFTNYSYEVLDRHLQVYTEWGVREIAEISKATQVRVRGGIKSPVLRELAEGETVELLEETENWFKVKTSDSLIGYVEKKHLENFASAEETPVTDYVPEEYTSIRVNGKLCLGWHSVGGPGSNAKLDEMLAEGKGINVIAPTWFSLTDSDGTYRSFADRDYVDRAHDAGVQVWGVWDDFNYALETGDTISLLGLLSSTTKRQRLTQNMVNTARELGLDGINIDFEKVSADSGEHYVQFLRELSVLCRREKLSLSVDNHVPFDFNKYYRLDVQGRIADYVIMMGYDEHWHGGGEVGSVASIDFVSNGLDRMLSQVPAEKVVNALPFYMLLWKTEGAGVTDQVITLNYVESYLSRLSTVPVWNEETCQKYVEWKSGNEFYQMWIEDEESIKVKLNVMTGKGIGGVAVWRIGFGTEEAWALVTAYANQ